MSFCDSTEYLVGTEKLDHGSSGLSPLYKTVQWNTSGKGGVLLRLETRRQFPVVDWRGTTIDVVVVPGDAFTLGEYVDLHVGY